MSGGQLAQWCPLAAKQGHWCPHRCGGGVGSSMDHGVPQHRHGRESNEGRGAPPWWHGGLGSQCDGAP